MRRKVLVAAAMIGIALTSKSWAADNKIAIAIHGGAGTIDRSAMTVEKEKAYIDALREAVLAGYERIAQGLPGEDAVIAAVQVLEQSPLFNAGVGAVYTYDELHELDAAIMHGGTREAGAVAGVRTIASPIKAAHAVMRHSPHVLLMGAGAEAFAARMGMEPVENKVFNTDARYEALKKAKARIDAQNVMTGGQRGNERFGTVGAVVLDKRGHLVAGTSTGGMTAKRYGRVGDAPIIGAGTYADDLSCAVSATGHGEYFIRYQVAGDICARVKYQGLDLATAADTVINKVLKDAGGEGGVIAIDKHGNLALPFNSNGMYRAMVDIHGRLSVGIYDTWMLTDEPIEVDVVTKKKL